MTDRKLQAVANALRERGCVHAEVEDMGLPGISIKLPGFKDGELVRLIQDVKVYFLYHRHGSFRRYSTNLRVSFPEDMSVDAAANVVYLMTLRLLQDTGDDDDR